MLVAAKTRPLLEHKMEKTQVSTYPHKDNTFSLNIECRGIHTGVSSWGYSPNPGNYTCIDIYDLTKEDLTALHNQIIAAIKKIS